MIVFACLIFLLLGYCLGHIVTTWNLRCEAEEAWRDGYSAGEKRLKKELRHRDSHIDTLTRDNAYMRAYMVNERVWKEGEPWEESTQETALPTTLHSVTTTLS